MRGIPVRLSGASAPALRGSARTVVDAGGKVNQENGALEMSAMASGIVVAIGTVAAPIVALYSLIGIGGAAAIGPLPGSVPLSEHAMSQVASQRRRRIRGALAYLGSPLGGAILLLVERNDRFVRFHAAQSLFMGLLQLAVGYLLFFAVLMLLMMPPVGWLVAALLGSAWVAGCVAQWLTLTVRAARGSMWRDPIVGEWAWRFATRERSGGNGGAAS